MASPSPKCARESFGTPKEPGRAKNVGTNHARLCLRHFTTVKNPSPRPISRPFEPFQPRKRATVARHTPNTPRPGPAFRGRSASHCPRANPPRSRKSTLQPRKTNLQPCKSDLRARKTNLQPGKNDLRPRKTNLQPRKTDLRPRKASLQPDKANPQAGESHHRDTPPRGSGEGIRCSQRTRRSDPHETRRGEWGGSIQTHATPARPTPRR